MWTKLFTTACVALVATGASITPNKPERQTVKQKRQSSWNYRPQNYGYEQYDYLPELPFYPNSKADYYPKSEPVYYPKSEPAYYPKSESAYYSKPEPTYQATSESSNNPTSESAYYQKPKPESAYYPKPQPAYYPLPQSAYPSKYESSYYPKYESYRPYGHYKPSPYYDDVKHKPCKHEVVTTTTHAPSTTPYATTTHAYPSVPVKKPLKHGLINELLAHTASPSSTTERYHFVH